jgi:osmotically-inducible protein OsmY
MKRISPYSIALLATLLAGCGIQRPEAVLDRSRDSEIMREVQTRLAAEPALEATRIRVEVNGGMVILYGSVDGAAAWRCVHRNAQLVEGVTSVVDYLVIERGPAEIRCGAPRRPG